MASNDNGGDGRRSGARKSGQKSDFHRRRKAFMLNFSCKRQTSYTIHDDEGTVMEVCELCRGSRRAFRQYSHDAIHEEYLNDFIKLCGKCRTDMAVYRSSLSCNRCWSCYPEVFMRYRNMTSIIPEIVLPRDSTVSSTDTSPAHDIYDTDTSSDE